MLACKDCNLWWLANDVAVYATGYAYGAA
jgi:hypothetical protein